MSDRKSAMMQALEDNLALNLSDETRGWVSDTIVNLDMHLESHNSVLVSVSGGSDSNVIVHLIATYFRNYLPKIHFVFCNTGIEYRATLRHLDYMRERYGIDIEVVRGEPIPLVVKEYGVPVLSKQFSQIMYGARRGWKSSLDALSGGKKKFGLKSESQRRLAKIIVARGIEVSDKCCEKSKKNPIKKYIKENKCDLNLTGERLAEGGVRASSHHGCFETGEKVDKYMPLWWWPDSAKAEYIEKAKIKLSDCYELWGMKRTGCVGCPFNSQVGEDLKKIKKYEPSCYALCMNLFGESYRIMDESRVHRHPILMDESKYKELPGQMTFERMDEE